MSVTAERIRPERTVHRGPLTTHAHVRDGIRMLRARLEGEMVLPGDPGWDEARRAWNLAVDQRPLAVVLVESAGDVVEIVEFAHAHGLRIAPQGTGHGASTLHSLERTILVKTSRMRGVEIDASARRARVEAGALWEDVVEPAAEQGFVVLHGSSPDVGVVGYTLGGGMGWLARSRGLSANSVTAVELITADGRFVRAAVAASVSSRRSSSSCTPPPTSTQEPCSGRSSAPATSCGPGVTGPRRCPTR
jgi:FAD/FMN-containing dehydrogenase